MTLGDRGAAATGRVAWRRRKRRQGRGRRVVRRVTCCSSGRGRVAVGCDDGTVGLLDRGIRLSYGFQAHASSVLFLQQFKVYTRKRSRPRSRRESGCCYRWPASCSPIRVALQQECFFLRRQLTKTKVMLCQTKRMREIKLISCWVP